MDGRFGNGLVWLLAALTVIVIVQFAFFEPRVGGIDEISLFNPVYMFLERGTLAYPAHGWPDAMFVHPPVHTGLIARLMSLGLSRLTAEPIPGFAMLTISVAAMVGAPFPWQTRAALLSGLLAAVLSLHALWWVNMRPDADVLGAWLGGIVLLESGRQRNWSPLWLFAGGFCLAVSAGSHYYAWPAILGVVVYIGWPLLHPAAAGWKAAASVAGGAAAFGLPYLVLFVVPDWEGIRFTVSQHGVTGSLARAVSAHRAAIGAYLPKVGGLLDWLWRPLHAGLPGSAVAAAILLWFGGVPGLILAALPFLLFIWLGTTYQNPPYCLPEMALFAAAVLLLWLRGVSTFTMRWQSGRWRSATMAAAVFFPAAAMLTASGDWMRLGHWRVPAYHEIDIARAAGKAMLGPDARVGYRLSFWYLGGEAHWYTIDPDLHWPRRIPVDLKHYLQIFDAIAVNPFASDRASNDERLSASALYARGDLQLRGFFWAEDDIDFGYLLLAAERPPDLVGFARRNGRLYRFRGQERGTHVLVSADCPAGPAEAAYREGAGWSHYFLLPERPGERPRRVLSVVYPTVAPTLPPGCREVTRAVGVVSEADAQALLGQLRRMDAPIRFHQDLATFAGPTRQQAVKWAFGPDEGAIPVPHAFAWDRVHPASGSVRVEAGASPRVHIPPGAGLYGLVVPLSPGGPTEGRCWVEARLRIDAGTVTLAAYATTGNRILAESRDLGTEVPVRDLFLKVDSCGELDSVLVRGREPSHPSVARVESLRLWRSPPADGRTSMRGARRP